MAKTKLIKKYLTLPSIQHNVNDKSSRLTWSSIQHLIMTKRRMTVKRVTRSIPHQGSPPPPSTPYAYLIGIVAEVNQTRVRRELIY